MSAVPPPAAPDSADFRAPQPHARLWLWVALAAVGLAFITRFAWLTAKPLHHDESLFAYYAYFLYSGFGYNYQPILHGPVLQNVSALFFFLFGDGKFVMRLPAAVGGLGLLWVAWSWRHSLTRAGAAAAMALICLSPSLAYYSRFLRNDVPYLAVTMLCAFLVVRAVRTGQRRFWFWAVATAALAFSMMESSIFFFVACLWFLLVTTVTDWLGRRTDGRPPQFPGEAIIFSPRERNARRRMPETLALLGMALLLALGLTWTYNRIFSDSLQIVEKFAAAARVDHEGAAGILLLLLIGFVFILAAVAHANFQRPAGRRGSLHYFLRVAWNCRFTILMAAALGLAFYQAIFTTWFTHRVDNDFYGVSRPLTAPQIYKNTWDYWWDQHKLHRIKGPFHYYWMHLLNYELPLVLCVLTGVFSSLLACARRGRFWAALLVPQVLLAIGLMGGEALAIKWYGMKISWDKMDEVLHVTHPFHLHLALLYMQALTLGIGTLFAAGRFAESFLLAWTTTALFAYSYAGEKVPWLTVHVVGPACLLAGLYIARFVRSGPWPCKRVVTWCAIATIAAVWQFRSIVFVCFIHPHSPAERLVYNHTHPDVEYAVQRIDEIAHATNLGRRLPMLIRGEVEWPLYWYLREYTNFADARDESTETTTRPVVLVDWHESMVPNLLQNYTIRRLKVREWWEPPMLRGAAMTDIWRWLTPRESWINTPDGGRYALAALEWTKLWRYMAYRTIWLDPLNPLWSNGTNEFAFCVRRDLGETFLKWETLNSLPHRRDIPVYP